MKKLTVLITAIVLALIPMTAVAQKNVAKLDDGAVVYYSNANYIMLNLLTHAQVDYRVVSMWKDGVDLGYYFMISSNYGNPTISKENRILFRLDNGDVITCQALRDYGEEDKVSAQNATSDAASQKYIQGYYKVSNEDLETLMSSTIIKMRVEFNNLNVDLDEKKCKAVPKNIQLSYNKVNELIKGNAEEF